MERELASPRVARERWLVLTLARVVPPAAAILGVVLAARAEGLGVRLLGLAILVSALFVLATVPRALARRWRSQ